MRVRIAGFRLISFQENMIHCTTMKTASPQAKDRMMNIGARIAEL